VVREAERRNPRSLVAKLGHENLLARKGKEYDGDRNTVVIEAGSNYGVIPLWKGVEKEENRPGLRHGGAGDHEDPDGARGKRMSKRRLARK
jgi:hypothetical protein